MSDHTASAWNRHHPPGTHVRYHPVMPSGTVGPVDAQTRSEAWDLGDGTPVVKLEGKVGGVSLAHLEVLPEKEDPAERAARYRAALEHICDTVGQMETDGWSSADLQAAITEVHLTCLNAEPKFDHEDACYEGVRPWLLGDAVRLLRQTAAATTLEPELDAEVRELLKRADPLVNHQPCEDPEEPDDFDDLADRDDAWADVGASSDET